MTALVAVLMASGAVAEEVAPVDVVFDDGAVLASLTNAPGNPAEGRKIMNKGAGNCIACHAISDLSELPFHGEVGPALDGVADRWEPDQLRGIIANAKIMFPETMMPSFYKTSGYIRPGKAFTGKAAEGELAPLLTAQQVEDVVAYLLTLKEN